MTKARELSDYTGLAADIAAGDTAARAGRKNLIINGGFDVSQRGVYTSATSTVDGGYYLDRWAVVFNTISCTIQDMGGSVKALATSAATGSLRHRQKFEDMSYLSGKTVTISCQMKSNSANSRINLYADGWQSGTSVHTGGGNWESISLTIAIPVGVSSELSAHFGIDGVSSANVSVASGDYVEIKEVQLEVGSVATDFEHRSYGEELALCMRYYEIMGGTAAIDYDFMFIGAVWTTTQARFGLQWKVPKRTSPTVTESGTWYARNTSGQSGAVTSKSLEQPTPFGLSPWVTLSGGGLTAGNATQIWASDGKIIADAEL